MEKLNNKKYINYDYTSRYTSSPVYYDTEAGKEIYGIGTNLSNQTPYVSHKVKPEDTLDALALTYYANPTYWWIIAYFNRITDPFINLSEKFTIIQIPSISSIEFKNER